MINNSSQETEIAKPEEVINQTNYVTINLPSEYVQQHRIVSKTTKIFIKIMMVLFVITVALPIIDFVLQLMYPKPDGGFELLIIAPFFLLTLAITLITMPLLLLRYRNDSWVLYRAGAMLAISVVLLILIALPKSSSV